MTEPNMLTLPDGVRLAYTDSGQGQTILLHQGFSLTQMVWGPLVAELAESYRCVTFDPRGHGASDAPPSGYTLEQLASDVTEVAKVLDLRDVTLVGHSLGGAASLLAVADHNISRRFARLVLLGPAVPTFIRRDGQPYGVPQEMFTELLHNIENDFAGAAQATAPIFFYQTDPEVARRVFDATLAMRADVASQLFAAIGRVSLADRLQDVTIPTLGLWGEHDVLSDPRWAGWFEDQHLPGWELGTLPNSGHGAMLDEPEALAAQLREFIARAPVST